MGQELTTPQTESIIRPIVETYTHLQMVGLTFQFPELNKTVGATIRWQIGILSGSGRFFPYKQTETEVSEAATRNWLTATNTASKKNFIKLEEAMFGYLLSLGLITPGTIVVIPE